MATIDQKKRLFKAKIAVALHSELGRVPKKEEIEQVRMVRCTASIPQARHRPAHLAADD
jgi:hypothetical protein